MGTTSFRLRKSRDCGSGQSVLPDLIILPKAPAAPLATFLAACRRTSGAEADLTGRTRADLDVGELVRGNENPTTLGVHEDEHAGTIADCLADQPLHLVTGLLGVDDQFAVGVLHADLDLHRRTSSVITFGS